MRPVRFAAACLLAVSATLPAQEIFWDGFDQSDLCAWSNPPAVYQELEGFDESGQNDYYEQGAQAELVPRCVTIEGTIGEPYDTDPESNCDFVTGDIDYYELDVDGPALIRVRLERFGASSGFLPYGFIEYTNDFGYFGEYPFDFEVPELTVLERQIYLPENGFVFDEPEGFEKSIGNQNKWLLSVDDYQNYQLSCPTGGVDNTYRLTVTIDPIVGPATIPLSEEPLELAADGSVRIFRIPPGVASLARVETFVNRYESPAELSIDSKVYVVKRVGSTYDTVKGNDDYYWEPGPTPQSDPVLIHYDSRLDAVALDSNPHYVIVDHYGQYQTGPLPFDLTISYLEP